MEKFNLEAAKAGKPICDSDGLPVKFIAHVPEATTSERVIVLHGRRIVSFYENGFGANSNCYNLFMAAPKTVKKTGWVKVTKANLPLCVSTECNTRATLNPDTEIAARIEWEEAE